VALMVAAMRAGYVGALPGAILMRICAACGAMAAMLAGLDLLLPPVGAALRMAVLVGGGGTAFLITAILVRAVPRQLIRG
jgi:hypothetical protein